MFHQVAVDDVFQQLTAGTSKGHWPIVGWVCCGAFLENWGDVCFPPVQWEIARVE